MSVCVCARDRAGRGRRRVGGERASAGRVARAGGRLGEEGRARGACARGCMPLLLHAGPRSKPRCAPPVIPSESCPSARARLEVAGLCCEMVRANRQQNARRREQSRGEGEGACGRLGFVPALNVVPDSQHHLSCHPVACGACARARVHAVCLGGVHISLEWRQTRGARNRGGGGNERSPASPSTRTRILALVHPRYHRDASTAASSRREGPGKACRNAAIHPTPHGGTHAS